MLKTKKSNPDQPPRILAYGPEGVGKSTFGALGDNPIFITPEGGADRLRRKDGGRVDIMENSTTWDGVMKNIDDLTNEAHDFTELVLDSADWLEQLAHAKIIGTSGKTIITVEGGYGGGYRKSQNMHKDLIDRLDKLRLAKKMKIIIIAHAHVKAVRDPEAIHDYDAAEIKCHELVSSLWREWVDALIFVRFVTLTKESDDGKVRAFGDGDKRIAYTVKQPAFQAKNRFGMPPEMPFDLKFFDTMMDYVKKGAIDETPAQIRAELDVLVSAVTDAATNQVMKETIAKAGDNPLSLSAIRERVKAVVNQNQVQQGVQ